MPSKSHIRQKACFGDYASSSSVESLLDSLHFPRLDGYLVTAASKFRLENPCGIHGSISKPASESYLGHYSSHSAWRPYTLEWSLLAYFPPWLLIIQRLCLTIPDVAWSSRAERQDQSLRILIGQCGRNFTLTLRPRVESMPDNAILQRVIWIAATSSMSHQFHLVPKITTHVPLKASLDRFALEARQVLSPYLLAMWGQKP